MAKNPHSLLLFLYSNGNILGSVLGILGLLIFCVLAQILGGSPLLIFIVPALYAIGWLTMWITESPAEELKLKHQLTAGEIRLELENLTRSIRKKVPKQVSVKVESIKTSILEILPHIVDVTSSDYAVFTIRRTALDYLPETLENYLRLPRAFRDIHPVKDGKTATQLLIEQLDLLDEQMKEIVQDFYKADTQRLMAHGRFLESKFKDTSLWFDED
jgi:hypothetical protein